MKRCLGSSGAFDKMCALVRAFDYVNLEEADKAIEWDNSDVVERRKWTTNSIAKV